MRARMVDFAQDWQWSSAQAHVTGIDASGLLNLAEWRACWTPEDWRSALERESADVLLESRIRAATLTGRPLGSSGFTSALEVILQRPLSQQKRGRKPQQKSATAAA